MPCRCHQSCPFFLLSVFLDDRFDFRLAVLGDERSEFVDRQAGLIPFDDLVFRCFLHSALLVGVVYLIRAS